MTREQPELWTCPNCGERFTTAHQWHSCGTFSIEELFRRSDPSVLDLYERFRRIVEECGPVRVIPQKSRVAFQVRMRFAALMPQKRALKGHLVLGKRCESSCFERIVTFSPRSHVHIFKLASEADLNDEFRRWVRDAYKVGCQEHLVGGAK
ncbi:MAG TPA: DUF5655 domain-containing protein [Blastocatellia bacterium]|jgi:hypothetical protein|nr:DUF5655 domain-containing protein [Blastocatellia bacterium]